ncbi:hypothetical protein C8A03DRAFT_37627 [Achaetomium macrosporum]|uniref:Heterokaryon incompatibility domain-containing protein n=1 Tax=Achaetomium macrosporum TaxID=79813 RepID=A0AAN7C3A0_9PEZI|nr:hypothetical protein C8A03DRAFT_37627 [Achaetomium macrosporum]
MQHLADESFVDVKSAPRVLFNLDKDEQKSDIEDLFKRPNFTYNDFVAFLEDRGWTADRKDDFKLKEVVRPRKEKQEPGRGGGGPAATGSPVPSYNREEIWQAWLFFALIACVVRKRGQPTRPRANLMARDRRKETLHGVSDHGRQDDQTDGTVPILTFKDLVNPTCDFLTTEKLPAALQEWHDCIKATNPKAKLRARLIEADRALELARRVIRANLVPKLPDPEESASLAGRSPRDSHRRQNGYGNGHALHLNGVIPRLSSLEMELTGARQTIPEDEPGDDRFPELSLCLMVLGETLSAAKKQIMSDLGLRINGWLVDDDEGWGPPSYVLSRMEKSWCPRARAVLQGQLGSSAILLYTAFEVHQKKPIDKSEHQRCNAMVCYHVPGVEESNGGKIFYKPQHHSDELPCASGKSRVECRLLGPKMNKLYSILSNTILATESSDFPILRIVSSKEPDGRQRVVGVSVEKWSIEEQRGLRRPNFTAISHVWSQGMGNETSNRLQECQLEIIYKALAAVQDDRNYFADQDEAFKLKLLKQVLDEDEFTGETDDYVLSPPFWMDTLAIPVKQRDSPANFKELKMRAIRQIYHVFSMAARVIVIDKELCDEIPLKPFPIIISLLTSAWMQRLWTLQEAFLSRNLLVAFRGVKGNVELTHTRGTFLKLQDIDSRIRELDRPQKDAHTTAMAELVKRKFFHNLMGEDREIRNRNDHPIQTRGSMVIASAWRSSRWRAEDETLALSTLLNLDYRTTAIEEATVAEPTVIDGPSRSEKDGEEERKARRERMVCDFWTLIHKNYEGSIPAGLIFLPGDKLPLRGFGWAPTTWMSAKDEYYPYPLTIPSRPTELHEEGLLVQYPGFLLQCGHPNAILGSNLGKSGLKFPVDQYMSEWYQVKAIGKIRAEYGAAQKLLPRTFAHAPPEFGVILCRPKPREWPEEIGVLVEIYRETWKRKEPERVSRKYLYSQCIRLVWVSRYAPTPDEIKNYKLPSGKVGDQPIGELVPEDTFWYVDGYQANRDDPAPDSPVPELPAIKGPESRGLEEVGRLNGNTGRAFALMRRVTGSHPTQQPVRLPTVSGSDVGRHGPDVADGDVEKGVPPSQREPSQHSVSGIKRLSRLFGI